MQQTKKLLLAGSHAGSTAISLIEEIKKQNLPWEIHWLGSEYKNFFKGYDIIFHNLESGKIENKFTQNSIKSFLKIPFSFLRGRKIMMDIKPDLTFSFGSAAGAISVFWSYFMKVPIVIHEQTAAAGRANIFSSYFANKILLWRESSLKYFSKTKSVITGNPINPNILKFLNKKPKNYISTILVTGGSRGSTWINSAIKPILPTLLDNYIIFHQTGEANLDEFKGIKHKNYFPFGQVSPKEMTEAMSASDLVISRAGANTISELIVLKKPSILIPIPWTYNDEQTQNAKYMENLGLAKLINQKDLSAQKLMSEINNMRANYLKIIKRAEKIDSEDINAAPMVVEILKEYLNK